LLAECVNCHASSQHHKAANAATMSSAARQHLAFTQASKRPKQDNERDRFQFLRFLYPLDAALKGADA